MGSFSTFMRQKLGFTFGFTRKAFQVRPELIPIFIVMITPPTLSVIHLTHCLFKPDIRFIRSRGPPHQDVRPMDCSKYYNSQPQDYRPIPELQDLKKDMRHDSC